MQIRDICSCCEACGLRNRNNLDCVHSSFCSKIRGEEHRDERKNKWRSGRKSRSPARVHIFLFFVLPHGFSSKRNTARSLRKFYPDLFTLWKAGHLMPGHQLLFCRAVSAFPFSKLKTGNELYSLMMTWPFIAVFSLLEWPKVITFASLYDWLRKLAPLFHAIRIKTKTKLWLACTLFPALCISHT